MNIRPFASKQARNLVTATALIAAGLLSGSGSAKGGMMLTAEGLAQGFSLSTFASGYSSGNSGQPRGIAFAGGGVLVSDTSGDVRRFPSDADGQNVGSVPVGQNYGSFNATDLATAGGKIYLSRRLTNEIDQINADGTLNQVILSAINNATGLVTNPANGHLYVSTLNNNNVYDVDPVAKTQTLIFNANFDGITLSPDGKILYGASGNNILGFDLTTMAHPLVFDSGPITGVPDGAIIGLGPLLGNIYANTNGGTPITNGGTFVQINLLTKVQTVIGTGGSRGDFVTLDPTNGTLLLTQTESILRLTPPPGGFGPSPVPEPATYLQATIAACGLGLFWRFRRR